MNLAIQYCFFFSFIFILACHDADKSKTPIEKKVNSKVVTSPLLEEDSVRMARETKYMISTMYSSQKPTFRRLARKQFDLDETCNVNSIRKGIFNLKYVTNHDSSSIKSGKSDGKSFCISKEKFDAYEVNFSLKRTEGGHIDDRVVLSLTNFLVDSTYALDMYYHFGREGYDLVIESYYNEGTIERKMIEKFGSGSSEKIPRCVTTQTYLINKEGQFHLAKQEIKNYNLF